MKPLKDRIREIAEIHVTSIISPRQEVEDIFEAAINQALAERTKAIADWLENGADIPDTGIVWRMALSEAAKQLRE